MRKPRTLAATEVQDGDRRPPGISQLLTEKRGLARVLPGVGRAEEAPPEMQLADGTWPLTSSRKPSSPHGPPGDHH